MSRELWVEVRQWMGEWRQECVEREREREREEWFVEGECTNYAHSTYFYFQFITL